MKEYLTTSVVLRIITAGLLFFALAKQPYDYFTILRIATCLTSGYLIYVASRSKSSVWIIVFLFVLVLFNPIVKFPIKRETWQIIDIVVGITMLASILLVNEPRTKQT